MAIRRLKEAERGISALTKTASKAAASVQSNASGSKKVTTSKPTQTHTTTSGTIQRMVSAMTSNSSSNNRPMGVSKAGAVATRKNNFTQSELNRNTNIGQTGYNAIKGKGQEYAGSILKSAVTAADDFTKGKGTLGKFLENTPAGDINRAIKGASTVAGLVRAAGKDTEPVKAYESGLKTADKTAGKMINAGESELQTLKEKATANGKHVKAKEFGLDAAWTAADVAMDVGLTRLAPGTSEMTTAKYTSKAGQIVGGIAKRGGNRAVGDALMGMRSYGAAKQQALEAGASEEEADRNGLVNAATEIMSERLFSANKILAGTYGQGFADSVVDTLQQKLVSKVAGKTRKEVADFVSRNAASMLEEGLEEIVAEGIEPRAANLIYGNALKEEGIENTTLMVDDLASRYNLNPQMVNTLKDKINNGASDDSIAMTLNDLMASGVTQDEAREILASYMDANSKIQTADYARSFGLGAVVGGIFGGVSNVSALNQARDVEAEAAQYFGEGGINEALKKAMASEDAGTAAKASALYDELQSTGSISNVAAKEMLDAALMQDNMDSSREQSSRSAAARSISEQNYANPFFVNEDGSIEHTGTSQSIMDSVTQQTAQIISSTPEMAGLSESEVQSIASAVGSYAAGTLTAKESNVFAYENTEARAAFQEVTGLELPVVTAKNGSVNIAETNKATKDFLFGGTATNAVDVARQETDAMRTNLKGQTEQAMLNNLGAKGQEAFAASQDAMPSAMPRDIAENAQGFKTYYDAGRNGRMVFSAVDDMIGSQFKNIPEETRRAAYEAGQEDAKRSIREASRQGEAISRIAEENRSQLNSAPERGVLSIELDTADGTAIHKSQIELFRLLAESLNLNIHIVSGTNPMVQGSNGAIKVGSGDMYLNATMLGEGHADRVLEYVFGHEITHHIKIYAPEEYARLENLVRQRWYERDSNGMSKAIRDKQKLYKDRVNQELTESEALEEIIADATYEMFNDEEFMTRVAEQEPALGKAILNAIQKIMANIREVLARGRGFTPRQNAELFSQLDILKEAEELWLNGLATARLNAAAVGNLEYASERFSLKNKNINPNDRIPYVENDSYINVPRGDAEALNSLEASVKRIQRESFENAATGYKASITSETVGKIIHPSKKMDRFGTKHIRNLNAAVKLPQLFENAVYVDTKNNQKKRGSSEKLHHFVAPIRMNGEEYRARIVARDRVNTDILYIINVEIFPIKKGTPLASDNASQSRGVPMDISIHELTKNVKIYDYYKADNEYYGFSDLKFSVRDQEYMDAVESGDMKKAQQMVGEAAKATGYATPDLYHGTSRFGFTGFDVEQNTDSKGLIYTTTKSVVSANYAGRDNYAGVRTIGRPYIQNATTNEDILSNANNVYGTNYRMATKDDRNSILKEVYDEALSIANKLNNLGTDSWNFEMTDQFSNDLAWSENMFWTITQEGEFSNIENIEEYFDDVQTLAESLREDIEQYHERYERLRNYLLENRDKIGDKGENSLYRLLLSYDFTDAAIDIEYKYYRALAIDRLAINDATDSINSIEQIKESSDATHGIGSYHLYGKLGENPYIMDANGKSWLNLEADIIDGVHSTDAIAKKAKELGYTSVVMKNIYDGGEMADNYIFFNSNQLKSADPVTYDDEGNVIPLSKRFNQDNKDIRFSISDVDSDGNALSEQQREYFKDSKVRDENGNLLVMYHGTSAAFTVFDKGHIGGTGRFEGSGFNFTSFEGRAMSYDTSGNGNTFRVYLNITNPISDKEKTLTKAKLTSIVRAIARNEDVDGFDSIVFAIHPPMKRTGRESFPESLRATVEYLLEYNESDADIYAAISTLGTYDEAVIEAFENEGYDGVIWHDYDESVKTAIAFEPEQIKNIDNLNPTADPDIRFSVNDDDMYKPTEGTVDNLWEGLNIGVRFSHGEGGTFFSSGIKTNRTTDKPTQAAINNNRMKSGKDMLEKALSENYGKGWRDEFSRVVSFMEAMNDFFVDAGTKYRFIGLQDVENSTVRVRRDGKKITGITMSAMIKNGEYPINFDFTTICKKRQAFNDVIEKLTKNKNVGEDISLSAAELMDINEALRAEGVETACLGCFVEARRYNMQNYTEKVVQKWNDAVDAYAKENGIKLEDIPDFNFANGQEATDQDFIDAADTFLSYKKSSMSKKNPGARFAAIIAESKGAYVKHLHAADLVTKQGVERIMDMGTRDKSFYGMLKAAYGVAAPKEIVKFVPYNSEIANLPKTKNKMPMDEYLKSIGGIRMQSFSDFLVANTFDYMQMVADAAARGFTAHAYTKEIAFARIFGKTGIKINMSVMFDVMSPQEWGDVLGISDQDRLKTIAKTYAGMQFFKSESDIPEELKDSAVKKKIAGVDGWLTYLVGDEDRSNRGWEQLYKEAYELTGDEETATQIANEGRNWVQSINFREAKELQKQEGYAENVGVIAVGLSDENIRHMMNDDNIPYIIPYHASGLPEVIKQRTNLNNATDYTDTQNTRIFVKATAPDGTEYNSFDEFKKLKGDRGWKEFYKWLAEEGYKLEGRGPKTWKETNDDGKEKTITEINPHTKRKYELHGTGEFDVYDPLEKGNTPQQVAEQYMEDCAEQGLLPVFYQFAGEDGYCKVLFDYSVVNLSNGATAPQQKVRNNYPGVDVDAGESDYSQLQKIIDDEMKKQDEINERRDAVVEKVANDFADRLTIVDSEGNELSQGQRDYFANSKATDEKGNLLKMYHGTESVGFTIFDPEMSDDGISLFFTDNIENAASYSDSFDAVDLDDEDREDSGNYAVYLNITNPYVVDADGRYWDQLILESDSSEYTVRMTDLDEDEWTCHLELIDSDGNVEIDEEWDLDDFRDEFYHRGMDEETIESLRDGEEEEVVVMLASEGNELSTRDIAEIAKEKGHDGVIFKNIVDYGQYSDGDFERPSTVIVAFNSEQIKLVDNLDPTNNPDIRFSLKLSDDYVVNNEDEFDELPVHDARILQSHNRREATKSEIAQRADAMRKDTRVTKGKVVDVKSIEPAVRELIMFTMEDSASGKKYKQSLVKSTVQAVKLMYTKIQEDDFNAAAEIAYDTALEIAENITLVYDDMWEQYKELRDYIKKTPMALADQDKQDIPDYSEWRKANFGNFRIKSDGLPVYTMYSQLNEMWPEFFSADITHPADQAMRIADVMEQLKPYEYAYTSEEADALAKELSNDLCNIAFAGTSWKSYADKAKEKLARETAALKQRHMEAQNDIRTAERIAAGRKVAKVKNQYESKIESMRSKYESKLDAEKQKVKDVKQSEKEKRQAQQWLAVERETAVKDQAEMKRQKQQERHNAKVKKLTENANMRVAREKRKLQDYRSRVAEQKAKKKTFKERAKHFGKIKDNYMWLTSRLLKPTKDKHIPEEFRVALSEVLQMFDLQTERSRQLEAKYGKAKSTSKLDDLRTSLERISSEEGSDSVFVYNGHIFQLIDSLAAKMRNGLSVDQFGDKELKEVDILLTAIRHNIANQNQAFADGIKRKITELAEDSFDAFAKRVELYGEKATLTGVRSYVDSILNEAAVTPRDFFDLIGGGLNTVFLKGLRKGHDKHIMNIDYVRKEFDVLFKPYAKTSLFHKNRGSAPGSEIEGWRDSTNVQTFKLGETAIKMTPAQMMSLYCLIKREQAAGHVFGSGFVVTEIDPTVQTKNIAKTIAQGVRSGVGMKLQNNNVKVMISYEEAQEIVGKLSPDQIKMANSLQQMLEGKCADWGNETSMKLFGYKMFKEKNYFPIQSAHEYLNTDYGKHQNVEKIKNFGFTKPLEAGANNAIVIDDIFDVVADHINKMSLYNAFACPISDMTRLMNTVVYNDDGTQADSIKAELKRAYGSNALRYVETFLADVQTQQQTRKDGMRNVITRSLANQKKALIGFSLSVLVQQPTAIVRAFNEIDVKWFANADSAHIKTNIAEMKAHCPIALWKSWGFSQLEMANSIDQIMMNKEWSRVDLVTMQPYGFADMVTWSFIWAAVKNEVSAKNPSVEYGSDEYWELCNDRASEVFDLTQVVDSPMHRSQAMRNDDIMIKQMMSFMAEPTRTLNMLRTNIIKARELKKTGNDKQAANMLAKTTTVFVANAAACSAAKAFVDAFRDQFGGDEPDYENFLESWLNNFLHNLKSNANPITMTPFFKDLWQLGEGFGPSNTALEGWEKLIVGGRDLVKAMTNGGEGLGKAVWKFTQGIGYVTGIPIKNFARDVNSTLNFFGIQINPLAAEKGGDSDMLKLLEAAEETGEYVAPYTRSIDGANKSNGKFLRLFEIKEGGGFDNFLDKHGFTLSDAEYSAKLQEERAKYVEDKVAAYSGDERKKQVNSAVTGNALYKDKTYSDGAKINLTNAVSHGDYATVKEMREIIEACGGDLEACDKSVESKTGSAYRKLVGDDSYEAWDKRDEMETYLRETKGWTQDDISHQFLAGTYGGKKCELAKQFQVAFAEGNETEMFNTLVSLYEAGLTDDDYQQLVLKASSATKAYDYSSGSFGWPAENNAGQIVQHIGTNGSDYTTFATDSGAGITAADGGKVTFVGVYKTKGAQVVIDHGNGYKSYYTGMTAFNVPQGRVLRKGDVIAYSGGTFTLKVTYNGQVVDPEQVLNM